LRTNRLQKEGRNKTLEAKKTLLRRRAHFRVTARGGGEQTSREERNVV